MRRARIPRKPPTPGERSARQHIQKRRQRGAIRSAIQRKADADQQRDEHERQIDHAAARSIEWARRQYILNSPAPMATKLLLLHGD